VDFKELVGTIQRRWLSVAAFFLLALVAAAAVTFTMTPQYESESRIYVSTEVSGDSTTAVGANTLAIQRVQSYAQLATSREVMQKVISKLNLNLAPAALKQKITSSVAELTAIIVVKVRDDSAESAQAIAKAESEVLAQYLAEIETPFGKSGSPIKATIVDPASYNANQVSPQPVLNLTVAALIGLVLGIGVAIVRDLLDNTVHSAGDIEAALEAPVLAGVPFDADIPKHPLLTEAGGRSPRVEAFRLLRTNLQFLNLDTRPRSLVITSAVPGEGKTSTATNLAIALAQTGQRILLVDGDLRRPRVAGLLGLERSVGLTTVLVGRSELDESIQKHSSSGIYFLASGPIPPNPTEVLQSNAAQSLFDKLNHMFDMVIIDAPPLLPVSDAAILGRDVDGAILVVRHGKTSREQLRQARLRLAQVDANLFGVAVNMTPRRGRYAYEYGYGYDYDAEVSRR
jgi:capsular exopolysaccharide synthesis family protein